LETFLHTFDITLASSDQQLGVEGECGVVLGKGGRAQAHQQSESNSNKFGVSNHFYQSPWVFNLHGIGCQGLKGFPF
jgi:hypothetical protein